MISAKHKITVAIPQIPASSYVIHVQSGLLQDIVLWLPKHYKYWVIISDEMVAECYGQLLVSRLKQCISCDDTVLLLTFPSGEKFKNTRTKKKLEEMMLSHACSRHETLILALGGGITGDIAGFVAATYMRGIPYIQIPTTLLAMVDSSVGGKVGINTPQGKNLIGAFWQPLAVIADINLLKTIDKKQFVAGLIEAMKMFLTHDRDSVHFLVKYLPQILLLEDVFLTELIYRAVKIKACVVNQDEKETGMRMALNFGHTIGHALEKVSLYRIGHGYAVGYGILIEAKISEIMGVLSKQDYQLIQETLASLGIHGKMLRKYPIKEVIASTYSDKKVRAGCAYYVLLEQLGTVYSLNNQYAHPVAEQIVTEAFIKSLL